MPTASLASSGCWGWAGAGEGRRGSKLGLGAAGSQSGERPTRPTPHGDLIQDPKASCKVPSLDRQKEGRAGVEARRQTPRLAVPVAAAARAWPGASSQEGPGEDISPWMSVASWEVTILLACAGAGGGVGPFAREVRHVLASQEGPENRFTQTPCPRGSVQYEQDK